MRRFFLITSALLALASITFALPVLTWDWDEPTTYENTLPIDQSDTLTYTLHCNDTPGQQGPPYEVQIPLDDAAAPPSVEDMAAVHNNVAGTYYCAATAFSNLYTSESGYSNETNFTVTTLELGYVPLPPSNLRYQ